MKLHALMNRLEDIGEDRDVIIRVGNLVPVTDVNDTYREYDIVGCDTEGPGRGDNAGPAILLLRERAAITGGVQANKGSAAEASE